MITDEEARILAMRLANKILQILKTTDFKGDAFDTEEGLYQSECEGDNLHDILVDAVHGLIGIEMRCMGLK